MADAKLRRRERELQGGESLLRARARVGEISTRRLRLALYLGSEAAGAVLETILSAPRGFDSWVRGVCAFGPEVSVRLMVACAPFLRLGPQQTDSTEPRERALDAAEDWVVCPCSSCAEIALAASAEAEQAEEHGWFGPRNFDWVRAPALLARAAWLGHQALAEESLPARLEGQEAMVCLASQISRSSLSASKERIREAVRGELLAWCLGASDPVRDRALSRA